MAMSLQKRQTGTWARTGGKYRVKTEAEIGALHLRPHERQGRQQTPGSQRRGPGQVTPLSLRRSQPWGRWDLQPADRERINVYRLSCSVWGALFRQPRGLKAEGLRGAGGWRWSHLGCRVGIPVTDEVAPGSRTEPSWDQSERWLPTTQDRGPFSPGRRLPGSLVLSPPSSACSGACSQT